MKPVAFRLDDLGIYQRYRVTLEDKEGEVFALEDRVDEAIIAMVHELAALPLPQ